MKVTILDKKMEREYEEFLLGRKSSLLYHSVRFKKFLEALLECDSEYLVALEDGRIRGVLPLMRTEGKFGRVYNSLPFYGSNGGPLTDCDEALSALTNAYNVLAKEEGVAAATVITNPLEVIPSLGFTHNTTDTRISQLTELSFGNDPAAELLTAIDSSARRNVRKAERSGMEIEVDNGEMGFLMETHYENMAAIGGIAKPERFFELVGKFFEAGKDYNIYIARMDGEKAGALLLFYYNDVVEYYVPATVPGLRTFQPLPLIIYKAMLEAHAGGARLWNWGGTWTSQDGVHRFKKKWGTRETEYTYYVTINNPDIYGSTSEELLKEYPNFYVVPFNALKSKDKENI